MRGLPGVSVDMRDTLWNVDGGKRAKRYTKSLTTHVEPEMFEAAGDLAHDPRLPFQGNMAAIGRHIWAAGIESLRLFLEKDMRTMWSRLLATRRQLTTEWFLLKIDEQLDMQVEILRDWTAAREWGAVVRVLATAAADIADYEYPEYKRRAAMGWLSHVGVRNLLARWGVVMQEDDAAKWDQVEGSFAHF